MRRCYDRRESLGSAGTPGDFCRSLNRLVCLCLKEIPHNPVKYIYVIQTTIMKDTSKSQIRIKGVKHLTLFLACSRLSIGGS